MAGHARYTALLDACVLYPLAMTDALMSLATAGFFAAKWSTRIEDEWVRALEKQRPELIGKLGVRRDSMRDAVPDWEVPEAAWSAITREIELPDPNDVHVLAAAIAGHADCIVTSNLKDFPNSILLKFGIEAIDPDTFIINQWDLDPVNAIAHSSGCVRGVKNRNPAQKISHMPWSWAACQRQQKDCDLRRS